MPKLEYLGLGRRKCSVARLKLQMGTGQIIVNDHKFEEYFPIDSLQQLIKQPLEICGANNQFDIVVNVKGGGIVGQAGAVRLALARALEKYDPEWRARLKPAGLLTRDARVKERKKYGLRGARRAFQFSKR